jgi:hypothetical protein
MSFTTAAQARSIVRQNWTTREQDDYRSLLDVVDAYIEGAAKNGDLLVEYKFADNEDVIHARMLAKELHESGFGVKLLPDSLLIYWGISAQND